MYRNIQTIILILLTKHEQMYKCVLRTDTVSASMKYVIFVSIKPKYIRFLCTHFYACK